MRVKVTYIPFNLHGTNTLRWVDLVVIFWILKESYGLQLLIYDVGESLHTMADR